METQQQNEQPHISIQSQYLKDLSFENPNAPETIAMTDKAPNIELALDLAIKRMPEENMFEVEISINAKASADDKTMFLIDLKYAGIFHLINIDPQKMEMLLAVHCPSMIFPYARKIIGDSTQSGGFQPLMIDPVDFGMLYAKKLMEQEENDENVNKN